MKNTSIKLILSIVFVLLTGSLTAQTNVLIQMKSGVEEKFQLNELNKITFGVNLLEIKNATSVVSTYQLDEIQKIRFGTFSSVVSTQVNTAEMYIYPNPANDKIWVKNVQDSNLEIALFSIDGKKLKEIQRYNNSESIGVSDLKPGIYLLLVNHTMIKFSKL